MKQKMFKVNYKKLIDEMNEYIEKTYQNYKEFNNFYKRVLRKEIIEIFGTKMFYDYVGMYEKKVSEVIKIEKGIISSLIASTDMKTGKRIYDYSITSEEENGELVFFLNVSRKDMKEDYYEYKIKENLENFLSIIKTEGNDIQEIIEADILEIFKKLSESVYAFVQDYINSSQEIDDDKILREILFILSDMDANSIYEIIKNEDSKK